MSLDVISLRRAFSSREILFVLVYRTLNMRKQMQSHVLLHRVFQTSLGIMITIIH